MLRENNQITINVKVEDLFAVLTTNLAKHEADYNTTLELWQVQVLEAIDKMINALESNLTSANLRLADDLPKPMNKANEYRTVLSMLKFATDTTIELTQSQYEQYVLDNWSWTPIFRAANSFYGAGATMTGAS